MEDTSWTASTWIALGGTLAVSLAVIAAVFQEPIRQRWNRAQLRIEIRTVPPDTHQINLTHPVTRRFISKAIYVRARVLHVRGGVATNAEVIVSDVWRVAHGSRDRVATFLPLPLTWSHLQPSTSSIRVPVSLFRHCDLGRFEPDSRNIAVFRFSTIVQPNPVAGDVVPNLLPPGDYEFELLLSGDNTNTLRQRWGLSFTPFWSDDESVMLGSVRIEPAD